MSPLVSAAQIDQLRTVAYRGLDTPVTIQRRTFVEGAADVSYTWATVITTTGWLRGMNRPDLDLQVRYAGATNIYRLHLRHDIDLQNEDRVVIGGETYEVQETNAENTIQIFLTALLRRIE
jgi:hypothetical protein